MVTLDRYIPASTVGYDPMNTTLLLLALILTPPSLAQDPGPCRQIDGETQKDKENLSRFCNKGISKGAVVKAEAMDSLLWISVPKSMATAMMGDRLQAEQLVKVWMRGWRAETGRKAVTVYVLWEDVEVAKGDTTWTGEDRITVKR